MSETDPRHESNSEHRMKFEMLDLSSEQMDEVEASRTETQKKTILIKADSGMKKKHF